MSAAVEMKKGARYNWKGQSDRLVYIGRKGAWHQFEKVDEPGRVWCEVLTEDLHHLEETQPQQEAPTTDDVRELIGANVLDTVILRHMGQPLHVMIVNDLGHRHGLPVNAEATRLYHANCLPGTTHEIRGDVFVAPDEDFA